MMGKKITFDSQGFSLEGKLKSIAPTQVALITHPHPLYGGDMDNPVVGVVSRAYQNNGWSTLRFNFRGTGNSDGEFDNGLGEQEDVDAAIAYLSRTGFQKIELAGYSFGAWVLAARARKRIGHPHAMRFIAPPVAFMDFKPIDRLEGLKQVIVGTNDEFAPLDQVEPLISRWNSLALFNVIDGADHFYWNQMNEIQTLIESSVDKANSQ